MFPMQGTRYRLPFIAHTFDSNRSNARQGLILPLKFYSDLGDYPTDGVLISDKIHART